MSLHTLNGRKKGGKKGRTIIPIFSNAELGYREIKTPNPTRYLPYFNHESTVALENEFDILF